MSLKREFKRVSLLNEVLVVTLIALAFSLFIYSDSMAQSETVYEDAQNGLIDKWDIYDNTPTGATIANVFDADKNSQVIELKGLDRQNGFRIGSNSQSNSRAWKNNTQTVIQWDAKFDEMVYYNVAIQTDLGFRYLSYTPRNEDLGLNSNGSVVQLGLGYERINGEWQTITRDLSADLKKFEPDNNIIEVNGLLLKGSCRLDNIQMLDELPDSLPDLFPHLNPDPIYEDAEDGSIFGWDVYDKNPEGAFISNVFDDEKNSRVIELSGDSTKNGYRLGFNSSSNIRSWSNNKQTVIQWDAKFDEWSYYYVAVETDLGFRYLNYQPRNKNLGITSSGTFVRLGIGYNAINGQWQTITRDLNADLKKFEPDNNIIEVNGILIKGSGRIDNIQMLDELPDTLPTTLLHLNADPIYEDAEDGLIFGWDVYDKTPEGAIISNVFDDEKDSRVIELSGDGRSNGYRIGSNSQSNARAWGNNKQTILQWDAKFYEEVYYYVAVQTDLGFRYLNYTPHNTDLGPNSSGTYIRFGIGYDRINGEWHTITRDLTADLKKFEPNNNIIEVNGILIRGSGRLDNIQMLDDIPDSVNTSLASVVLEPVYEDAEDETIFGWEIYDQTPEGASITNVFDEEINSRVIQLLGSGSDNGYRLGSNSRSNIKAWKNSSHKIISWDGKFDEWFSIFVAVQTLDGFRYINYSPRDEDLGLSSSGSSILIGLGVDSRNGSWQSFQRNLSSDLKMFEPNNRIIEVNGILVRGSGRLDNIKMLKPIDINPIFHGVSTGFIGIPNTQDDIVNVNAVVGVNSFSTSEGTAQGLAVRTDSDENIIFYSTEGVLPLGLHGFEVKDCCDGSDLTLFHIGFDNINGAPAEVGNFIFKVNALDVDGFEDEVTFNITVVNP